MKGASKNFVTGDGQGLGEEVGKILKAREPCLDSSMENRHVYSSQRGQIKANLRKLNFTNTLYLYQLAYSQVLLKHLNNKMCTNTSS
jgi:hypothetical protein